MLPPEVGNAHTGQAQVAHAGVADKIGTGHAGAQLASLRQRQAGGVERAPPNTVKCADQKI